MTSFWSYWISIITLGSIFGCIWLLYANRKGQVHDHDANEPLGHEFDGIVEYDNPMPKWWFQLFIATCIFGFVYLLLYPGLGNFKGYLGWSSYGHWEQEMAEAKQKYDPIFARYAATPIKQLAKDTEAMKVGQRLYANNCALCHGSTGRGSLGFPNLTDNSWLYGDAPETIKETITNGRAGLMPAKGLNPAMSTDDINDLTQYLLSFSSRNDDAAATKRGAAMFLTACAACHGADAKGVQAMGAPDLTDNDWLYGSTADKIMQSITLGRKGIMPAQKDLISDNKIHLLAAYVYSLSH